MCFLTNKYVVTSIFMYSTQKNTGQPWARHWLSIVYLYLGQTVSLEGIILVRQT